MLWKNPIPAEPLIPKPVRARLTKEAKANLRSIIKNDANVPTPQLKQEPVIYVNKQSKPQQLTLATASDWVMSGSELTRSIHAIKKEEKTSASVRLMHPDEIGSVIREGRLENPIEVCDDSDVEPLKCDESLVKAEKYSVDGYEELENMSDFDPDIVTSNAEEVFGTIPRSINASDPRLQHLPELGTELRLHSSYDLRRAKNGWNTVSWMIIR